MSSTIHLVTGGAGFIGSHLVSALLARGDRVRVIDNLATGKLSNIAPLLNRIEFIRADISDFDSIREAFEGVPVVFHQAAVPSVPRSVADPRLNHEANVNGTFNVLMAAREAGARRVVFATSSSVYGGTSGLPKREDMAPAPLSPYAAAKLAGEYYCRVFSESYGLETIALRYFNVFGPRQDPTSAYSGVISKFITTLLCGERPAIFGDGEQTRDFTYIDNVVAANLRAAEIAGACGQVLNIGTGNRTSLKQLLAALQRIIGTSIEPEYRPARQAEPRDSQADISLARQLLGYEPCVSFDDGLKQTVDWYREQTAEYAE
ncbi:MAG: SDR family oxidoreductase [Acidobacteria bacterium]|nr:SDR family oxidoreductase [Acidobacteriota bacterium]